MPSEEKVLKGVRIVSGDPLSGLFALNYRGRVYYLNITEHVIKVSTSDSETEVAQIIRGGTNSGAIFFRDEVIGEYFASDSEPGFSVTRIEGGTTVSNTVTEHPIVFILSELDERLTC